MEVEVDLEDDEESVTVGGDGADGVGQNAVGEVGVRKSDGGCGEGDDLLGDLRRCCCSPDSLDH